MSAPGDLRVGLCALAKDEGSYLEEWIAYHHLMGFGPIRVYAHDCRDTSHAVLARLAKAGLCEWEPFVCPPDRKPLWAAFEAGLGALEGRADWVGFVDLDEFVVTPRHSSIQAFLAEYGHLGAIAVNWKMFGSGGQQRREPGLVMERFTHCARADYTSNRAVKTLARHDAIVVPRVHTCDFAPGTTYQTVLGEALAEHAGRSERVAHDAIRVHHYFTRSREEWRQKVARGRGDKLPDSPGRHRTPAEFDQQDRNEERDTVLLRWVEPVKRLLAELNASDVEAVYDELGVLERRVQRVETENARLREALRRAEDRLAATHAALLAEERHAALLEARGRRGPARRAGGRVARLLGLRRGPAAARRQLPESSSSAASLTTQSTTPGR